MIKITTMFIKKAFKGLQNAHGECHVISIAILDLLEVKCSCMKFYNCRVCMTDFG